MDRYMGIARIKSDRKEKEAEKKEIIRADIGENVVIIDDSTIYEIDGRCMKSKNNKNSRDNKNNRDNRNNRSNRR